MTKCETAGNGWDVKPAEQPVLGAARPLTPLLDLWAKAQERGRAERYVRQKRDLIKRIAKSEGWESVTDLCSRGAVEWLTDLKGSTRTYNNSLSVLKTFGAWLVMVEELPRNPFAGIAPARGIRGVGPRALTQAELVTLFEKSPPERTAIYRLAYGTGLRRGELMQLVAADVELAARPQVIRVRPAVAKARVAQAVPLAGWVAELLRTLLDNHTPTERVFRDWPHDRWFRVDFERANIRDGPGGRRATFHSLRHTFITTLAVQGVGERVRQELARHSDPRLTAQTYTDSRLLPLAEAVARLPDPTTFPQVKKSSSDPVAKRGEIDDTGGAVIGTPPISNVQSAAVAPSPAGHSNQLAGDRPALAVPDSSGRNRTRTCCQPADIVAAGRGEGRGQGQQDGSEEQLSALPARANPEGSENVRGLRCDVHGVAGVRPLRQGPDLLSGVRMDQCATGATETHRQSGGHVRGEAAGLRQGEAPAEHRRADPADSVSEVRQDLPTGRGPRRLHEATGSPVALSEVPHGRALDHEGSLTRSLSPPADALPTGGAPGVSVSDGPPACVGGAGFSLCAADRPNDANAVRAPLVAEGERCPQVARADALPTGGAPVSVSDGPPACVGGAGFSPDGAAHLRGGTSTDRPVSNPARPSLDINAALLAYEQATQRQAEAREALHARLRLWLKVSALALALGAAAACANRISLEQPPRITGNGGGAP